MSKLGLAFSLIISVAYSVSACAQAEFDNKDKVRFAAEYQLEQGKSNGVLMLTIEIDDGHHIYGLPNEKLDSKKAPTSSIEVPESKHFRVDAEFVPDKKPIVIKHDPNLKTRIEKHKGTVIFWAPITVR